MRKESGVAVTVTPYNPFSLRAVPTVSQEPDPAERRGLAVVQALSAVNRSGDAPALANGRGRETGCRA
jgi:hypothetical protein